MFENDVFINKTGELSIYGNTYRIHIFKKGIYHPLLNDRYERYYFYFYIDNIKDSEYVCNLIKEIDGFNSLYEIDFSLKIFDLFGGFIKAENGSLEIENYFEYFYAIQLGKHEPEPLKFKATFESFEFILPEINNTI